MVATEAQVRTLVNDNPLGTGTDILDTSQYTVVLATESNLYRASALAARAIAATFATKVSVAAGSVRTSLQQKYEHYIQLADKYDFRAGSGGGGGGVIAAPELAGVSVSEMETQREDTDRVQPSFRRNMDSNPPLSQSGSDELLRSD